MGEYSGSKDKTPEIQENVQAPEAFPNPVQETPIQDADDETQPLFKPEDSAKERLQYQASKESKSEGSNDSTESEPIINVIQKSKPDSSFIRFLKKKDCRLYLCAMVEFLFVFSYFSLIQILPSETEDKGITDWMIGLIQGSVGGVAIISSFFYMPLSKIWQQRTFIMVSLFLTALCDILIAFYEVLGWTGYALFGYFQLIHIIMGFVRFTSFSAGGTIMTTLFMGDPEFRTKFGMYKSTTHVSALLGVATVAYYEVIGFRVTMLIPGILCLFVAVVNYYALPADDELGDSLDQLRAAGQNNKKYPFVSKPRVFSLLMVLLWCHTFMRYGIGGASSYFDEYYGYPDWLYALVLICSCLPSLVASLFLKHLKGDPRVSVFFFSTILPGLGCFFAKTLWGEVNIYYTFFFLFCMWEAITFVNILVQDNILIYLSQLYPGMKNFDKSKLASNVTVTLIFASLLIGPYLYSFASVVSTFETFLWYIGITFFFVGAVWMLCNDYFFKLEANKSTLDEDENLV